MKKFSVAAVILCVVCMVVSFSAAGYVYENTDPKDSETDTVVYMGDDAEIAEEYVKYDNKISNHDYQFLNYVETDDDGRLVYRVVDTDNHCTYWCAISKEYVQNVLYNAKTNDF